MLSTLYNARNDKARLLNPDFINWLNASGNSELVNKINNFYQKYIDVIENNNYFTAMRQINENAQILSPAAKVIQKCYSIQSLVGELAKDPSATILNCSQAITELNATTSDIINDYKDLADSLVGYDLVVDITLYNERGERIDMSLPPSDLGVSAYPIKTARIGNNLDVTFKFVNPGLEGKSYLSISFPLQDGKIELGDRAKFDYIPDFDFRISGSPYMISTLNGSILIQNYAAGDGSGEIRLRASKNSLFGLSPFSNN